MTPKKRLHFDGHGGVMNRSKPTLSIKSGQTILRSLSNTCDVGYNFTSASGYLFM